MLAILYSTVITCFGFWWAENFHTYTHSKGDESFLEIEIVGVVTILLCLCLKRINKSLSWKFILIVPVVAGLISILITLISTVSTIIGGTTLDNLRLYGIVHSIVTIIIFYVQMRFFSTQTQNRA